MTVHTTRIHGLRCRPVLSSFIRYVISVFHSRFRIYDRVAFLPRDVMLAQYMLSLYLSVRLSVTSRYCTKIAKRRITQKTTHNSIGTLTFLLPKIFKFRRRNPQRVAKQMWSKFKSAIFDKWCIVNTER